MQISEQVADQLLDKLASDDEYRTRFQSDPRAALASLGDAAAADPKQTSGAWSCLAVKSLASKEAIRASRDALRRQLTQSMASAQPITLEMPRR